jgi:hypothetical protein
MMEIELLKANLQALHQKSQYSSRGNESIAGNALAEIERLECELAHVRKVRNDSAEDMRTEIRSLREELAECKSHYEAEDCKEVPAARIYLCDQSRLFWQAQAFKFLQMRKALTSAAGVLQAVSYLQTAAIVEQEAQEALSIDTKTAEAIVKGIEARALRNAASHVEKLDYASQAFALRRMANEQEEGNAKSKHKEKTS